MLHATDRQGSISRFSSSFLYTSSQNQAFTVGFSRIWLRTVSLRSAVKAESHWLVGRRLLLSGQMVNTRHIRYRPVRCGYPPSPLTQCHHLNVCSPNSSVTNTAWLRGCMWGAELDISACLIAAFRYPRSRTRAWVWAR